MTLSLSPRYDLFRFNLPKDFLPKEIAEKYARVLNQNPGVLTTPIDYLNESIQTFHLPGFTGLTMEQPQHEFNSNIQQRNSTPEPGSSSLGRLNRIRVEPQHQVVYKSTGNPLDKLEREFKVTFRMNQGLYNYFMLYETIFHYFLKDIDRPSDPVLYIEILDETGARTGRVKLIDCHIDGIDGLDGNFNKTNRDTGTFDILFKFNNIKIEFTPPVPDNPEVTK